MQACVTDSHRHSGNRNRRVLERFVVYITRLQDAQESQDAAAQHAVPIDDLDEHVHGRVAAGTVRSCGEGERSMRVL